MSYGTIESKFKWIFGAADASTGGGPLQGNNVLGGTGAGVAFNTHHQGMQFTFSVEADANNTCAYQIRTSRTSSGPWTILSSGTLSSNTGDMVQLPGPLGWVSPNLKTIKSTAAQVVIRMVGI